MCQLAANIRLCQHPTLVIYTKINRFIFASWFIPHRKPFSLSRPFDRNITFGKKKKITSENLINYSQGQKKDLLLFFPAQCQTSSGIFSDQREIFHCDKFLSKDTIVFSLKRRRYKWFMYCPILIATKTSDKKKSYVLILHHNV